MYAKMGETKKKKKKWTLIRQLEKDFCENTGDKPQNDPPVIFFMVPFSALFTYL